MKKTIILSFICVFSILFSSVTAGSFLWNSNAAPLTDSERGDDFIYFFSQNSNTDSGCDMILVESNGRYGLIDASNNSFDSIEDEHGNAYTLRVEDGLVDPVNNGINNAKYMIDSLGVTHLDFVVATHSHSDHIGGIPEIANLEYKGVNLIDEETIFLYKEFKNVNFIDDEEWLDGAFQYQALKAMGEAGASLLSLSQGYFSTDITSGSEPDYTELFEQIDQHPALCNAFYEADDPSDAYDDYLEFCMGDFSIRLYNLFSTPTYLNENVNSICTVINKGNQNIVLLSDINNEQQVGQRLARNISEDIGCARVSLLKDAHHGAASGSNTKEEADLYRPVIDVATKSWNVSNVSDNYANFKYYCETKFGTRFYATGDADKALAAIISDDSVEVMQLTGQGYETAFEEAAVNERTPNDGWHHWDYEYIAGYYDRGRCEWSYFVDGVPLTGWQTISDANYYFDGNGFMQTGWLRIGQQWYYLDHVGKMQTGWQNGNGTWNSWYYLDPETGIMQTGWLKYKGEWYYLNLQGAMSTGWQRTSEGYFFFQSSGVMMTGWLKVDGHWYYLDPNTGIMLTNWQKVNGKWYYFADTGEMYSDSWANDENGWYFLGADGTMQTGWKKINGNWYYFNSSGILQYDWMKYGGKWYYLLPSSGIMATGWQQINGTWYYLKSSGVMAASEWCGGYWLNSNGTWTYQPKASWKRDTRGWWYGDTSGWYAKNSTQVIDGKRYSFDARGYMR